MHFLKEKTMQCDNKVSKILSEKGNFWIVIYRSKTEQRRVYVGKSAIKIGPNGLFFPSHFWLDCSWLTQFESQLFLWNNSNLTTVGESNSRVEYGTCSQTMLDLKPSWVAMQMHTVRPLTNVLMCKCTTSSLTNMQNTSREHIYIYTLGRKHVFRLNASLMNFTNIWPMQLQQFDSSRFS